MTALTGQRVSATLGDLLQVSNSGSGIDGTLRTVSDGGGTSSPLQLSSSYVNITALKYNSNIVTLAGAFTTTGAVSITGAMTVGAAFTTVGAFTTAGAFTTGGAVTFSGAFTTTFTVGANTSLTLPTSGTVTTTASKLSAFAATTSAELAGVISDETGSGLLVFGTSPTLTTPKIAQINDTNALAVIKTAATASAVNEVTVTNAATLNAPTVAATGTDTNIDIKLSGKGTGHVGLGQATSTDVRLLADQPICDSSGNELLKFTKVASAVNEFTIANNLTAGSPKLSVTGGDTDIDMTFQLKGQGTYNFLGNASTAAIIRLFEDTDNGANFTAIRAPASVGSNRIHTLPDVADGTLATYTAWTTFTPTVTSSTGGDTIPVYTTNSGRYTQIGNTVFCKVILTGDGGAEGSGAGQLRIALPVTASASVISGGPVVSGYMLNSATYGVLLSQVDSSATYAALSYFSSATVLANLTPTLQNNTTRSIVLEFRYEV